MDPFAAHRIDPRTVELLHQRGAHLVRVKGTRDDVAYRTPPKGCIDKGWQLNKCRLTAALYHVKRGGLLGLVPASIGYLVFDVDLDDDIKESSNIPKDSYRSHPQAIERAEKLKAYLQKQPKLSIPTYSGGLHLFYRCTDESLSGYAVPSSHWSVPGGEEPNPDVAYGQFRFANSQIVIWYQGSALSEMIQGNISDDQSEFLRREEIKALRLVHGSSRAGGKGQPLFGDITTDQTDSEESWIQRVESLQFPSMGRHDFFLTVAGALVMHMAHSRKVRVALERKFKLAIRNRTRKYDPGEVERMWKHAISTTRKALFHENRVRFTSDIDCKDYVNLRLFPQWREQKRPSYIDRNNS